MYPLGLSQSDWHDFDMKRINPRRQTSIQNRLCWSIIFHFIVLSFSQIEEIYYFFIAWQGILSRFSSKLVSIRILLVFEYFWKHQSTHSQNYYSELFLLVKRSECGLDILILMSYRDRPLVNITKNKIYQWRIQEFPEGGRKLPKWVC